MLTLLLNRYRILNKIKAILHKVIARFGESQSCRVFKKFEDCARLARKIKWKGMRNL